MEIAKKIAMSTDEEYTAIQFVESRCTEGTTVDIDMKNTGMSAPRISG